jgi:hypothetical protein
MHSFRQALLALWRNVGFVCLVPAFLYCVAGAFDAPRLNWGDSGSDYNVMAAGQSFQKYGFVKLRLTTNLMDRAAWVQDDSVLMKYTHYPQLPELANGVYRKVFRLSTFVQFRLIAIAISFAAFFFVYRLISTYWSRQTAQVALALWVTNPLWLQHADYLHHGPYATLFGSASVYCLVRALREDNRRLLFASGFLLFLTYCSSYDYWIFTPVVLALVAVHHFKGVLRREVFRTLAILAPFAVVAIMAKIAVNVWGLGGIEPFLKDLHYQTLEHTTDEIVRNSFEDGVWTTLFGRMERYFSLLLVPLAIFWAVIWLARARWSDRMGIALRSVINPVPLLLAAIPFIAIFRELWVAQYYPFLTILPFYAIGFATLIVLLVESNPPVVRTAGIALLLGLAATSVDEHVRFKKAFFDPAAIRTLGAQIDSLSPRGQRVLTNHNFDSAYRYFFGRRIFAMLLTEPYRIDAQLDFLSDPVRSPFPSPERMLFVQHKHLTSEIYDKGYYNVLEHYRLWDAWANPPRYRRFLDSLFADRDSQLTVHISRRADRIYESDYYVLWRLFPRDSIASLASVQPNR